jgi:hypothetical protein
MQIKQKMGAVRDYEAPFTAHTTLLQGVNLVEHARQIQHNAISNNTLSSLVQDARRNKVQRILVSSVIINGVAGISTTLEK